jgi:hypothetical protein
MSDYAIRALDAATWDAFAHLAEKHNGAGFGCWCTWFHTRVDRPEGEIGRPWKERLVREGKAHAALVFDGDAAVAWCQYGSPDELPRIYHRKEVRRDPHGGGARLSRHVFLRRQGLPTERRRSGGASWCPRPDREGGRRRGRGLPTGHAGQEGFVLVPLQRHAQPL